MMPVAVKISGCFLSEDIQLPLVTWSVHVHANEKVFSTLSGSKERLLASRAKSPESVPTEKSPEKARRMIVDTC